MRFWLAIGLLLATTRAFADVSVVASVDRNHVSFGESAMLTITVQGVQGGAQPAIPKVDGLTFAGPSTQTSVSIVNGDASQSLNLIYQVTPSRMGEFTIPGIEVNVGGKGYFTAPIKLVVERGATQNDLSQTLFAQVRFPSKQVYLGQTMPLQVLVFSRNDVPLRGFGAFSHEAEGLGFKFLPNLKPSSQVINGESFNVLVIEGAISPTRTGALNFGPCVLRAQLTIQKRGGNNWPFDDFFGRTEVREAPVTTEPVPIEVLPLPEGGRTADFAGAVGEWNLEVTAKPTEVAVGDPITLTIKISGKGNIDTVPAPKLGSLEGFKTYDPTTKTTKDELNTTGERFIQQVLIAKSTEVKELPEVRLAYFDPVARAYKTAVQPPVKLLVKAGSSGQSTIVGGSGRLRPDEKLGQDIVYLKGDFGPVPRAIPFCATPTFWALNIVPVLALVGGIGWKRPHRQAARRRCLCAPFTRGEKRAQTSGFRNEPRRGAARTATLSGRPPEYSGRRYYGLDCGRATRTARGEWRIGGGNEGVL